MPLFSVVIPTFNRAPFLFATLESVFAQRFPDYEVLVVDDGSTDDTASVIATRGRRIRYLRQSNQGQGAARNLGVRESCGEYVAFLDSDDYWFPWTLEVFARLIAQHGNPSIISGSVMEFREETEIKTVREIPAEADVFSDYLASSGQHSWVGAGMAVLRRQAFMASGGFTTLRINAEDHDLILRLGTASGFVQVRRPFTLAYRRHEGGITCDICRTHEGVLHLVKREKSGAFPGGVARTKHRLQIITRHVRPASMACLRNGYRREAWSLYRETAGWHLRLRRWKYLFGFPLLAVVLSS